MQEAQIKLRDASLALHEKSWHDILKIDESFCTAKKCRT